MNRGVAWGGGPDPPSPGGKYFARRNNCYFWSSVYSRIILGFQNEQKVRNEEYRNEKKFGPPEIFSAPGNEYSVFQAVFTFLKEILKPIKSLTENEHHETYYEMRCVKVRDEYGDENKICGEKSVVRY